MKSLLLIFTVLSIPVANAHLFRQTRDQTVINLARPDRDQPGDNSFSLIGDQYTISTLQGALATRLPQIFEQMKPSTDDPSIRNVSMNVNGDQVAFDFQKHVAIFWKSVEIGGTISVVAGSCPQADQTGFQILLNTSGSTSSEAQGYVNGARILVCAAEINDQNGHSLAIEMERDLYSGPQYEDWIGYLMGDFLRPFGQALEAGLK
jgi:hypothetical protein